jgi:hypothetical protein
VSSLKLEPFQTGIEHLLAELERLTLALHMDILRLRAARLLNEDNFRGLYVAEEQVDATLYSRHHSPDSSPPEMQQLAMQKAEMERTIAARCAASGVLPLNQLAHLYSLSTFQRDALLLSIAPEVDTRFETLFSYAQNDVTRKRPTVGLMLRLLASNAADRLRLRSLFSPDGPLFASPTKRRSATFPSSHDPFASRRASSTFCLSSRNWIVGCGPSPPACTLPGRSHRCIFRKTCGKGFVTLARCCKWRAASCSSKVPPAQANGQSPNHSAPRRGANWSLRIFAMPRLSACRFLK